MPGTLQATIKPFIGGLNTERTQFDETPQFTSDELNCRILTDGSRSRRYGIGMEEDGQYLYQDSSEIYSAFYWSNVNNKTNINLLVAQTGNTLNFRQAVLPFSYQPIIDSIDLTPYIIDSVAFNFSQMSYSTGAGRLFVVNKYMNSLLLTFNEITNKIEVEVAKFKIRDFEGIEDGFEIDEQRATTTPEHNYNLYNQGWDDTNISKFFQQKNKYPSNNLQWFLGKDATGTFQADTLLSKYFGNTPAPRGHYVLDAITKNRTEASGIVSAGDFKFFSESITRYRKHKKHYVLVGPGGTYFYNINNNSGSLRRVSVDMMASTSEKYSPDHTGNYSDTLPLMFIEGRQGSTWTRIASQSDVVPELNIESNKYVYHFVATNMTETKYEEFRIGFISTTNLFAFTFTGSTQCGDAVSFPYTGTAYRVCDANFIGGHFFYLLQNQVLFSQTVTENIKNYYKCYQEADPTSEEISDIVATDGGAITFNGIGDGVGLAKCAMGMLVFGSKAVYAILSGVQNNFTATEYSTQYINNAGAHCKGSIVETEEGVYYWSPQGIFMIAMNQDTGVNLISQNISVGTIQNFYQNIPESCKGFCRSIYDYSNRIIYWYYPSDADFPTRYDSVLALDLKYGAFTPYKFANGGWVVAPFSLERPVEIVPSVFLYAGEDIVVADTDEQEQIVVAKEYSSEYDEYSSVYHLSKLEDNTLFYSVYNSRDFLDWSNHSFDSYMVSFPIIASDQMSYKQTPIVQTTFKRTESSKLKSGNYLEATGCKYRTRWQWSIGDESNRWDMLQGCYYVPEHFENFKYLTSKIIVRGWGKAFQIELRNDGNKDMRIVGINTIVRGL